MSFSVRPAKVAPQLLAQHRFATFINPAVPSAVSTFFIFSPHQRG
jgi:hypothetical protein